MPSNFHESATSNETAIVFEKKDDEYYCIELKKQAITILKVKATDWKEQLKKFI